MKNKTTIAIIISLIAGFGLGYIMCGKQSKAPVAKSNGMMMHQMPDGSMMSNNDSQMNMDDMMKGMMAGLQGKTGDAFDKEFLAEMIVHHQGAVEMAESALQNAKHKEIKDLANAIIAAQNKEIEMMKGWQTAWYK